MDISVIDIVDEDIDFQLLESINQSERTVRHGLDFVTLEVDLGIP